MKKKKKDKKKGLSKRHLQERLLLLEDAVSSLGNAVDYLKKRVVASYVSRNSGDDYIYSI